MHYRPRAHAPSQDVIYEEGCPSSTHSSTVSLARYIDGYTPSTISKQTPRFAWPQSTRPGLHASAMDRHGPSLERHTAHSIELERRGAPPPHRGRTVLTRTMMLLSLLSKRQETRRLGRRHPRSYQLSPPHSISHSDCHAPAMAIPASTDEYARRAGSQRPAPSAGMI